MIHLGATLILLSSLGLAAAAIAVWIWRPALIQSRLVVSSAILLALSAAGVSACQLGGTPPGGPGWLTVGICGVLFWLSAIHYHQVLCDLPHPSRIEAARAHLAAGRIGEAREALETVEIDPNLHAALSRAVAEMDREMVSLVRGHYAAGPDN